MSMATTAEFGSTEDDIRSSTFSVQGEDHTLGNSLRYLLNKDPRVAFCGYSVPHPADNKVNIRVQTTGPAARDVFKDALEDLISLSQHVGDTFGKAVEDHKAAQGFGSMNMGTSGVTSEKDEDVPTRTAKRTGSESDVTHVSHGTSRSPRGDSGLKTHEATSKSNESISRA